MEDTDAQLHIKKRARRRLVGAVVFVSVVAVILPMVMDHQPRQQVQEVEIRIPGQDEKPFAPKFAAPQAENPVLDSAPVESKPAPTASAKVIDTAREKPIDKSKNNPSEKVAEKTLEKLVEKSSTKPSEKPVKLEKPLDKNVEKQAVKEVDAKRAAAILAGQNDLTASKSSEYLVLIGAFSNEANVKILKEKLGQQGIKTFSEPLDTPQGKKTRVRAGPFANREAADKALAKMKTIGVSGVVSAR